VRIIAITELPNISAIRRPIVMSGHTASVRPTPAAARSTPTLAVARYFSPKAVDVLAGRDEPLGRGRRQPVGVLFPDLIGFTTLAEEMTPEHVMALLRALHGQMEEEAFRYGGCLEKFIGLVSIEPRASTRSGAAVADPRERSSSLIRARPARPAPPSLPSGLPRRSPP
jgi:class 3 adenylate cyclase